MVLNCSGVGGMRFGYGFSTNGGTAGSYAIGLGATMSLRFTGRASTTTTLNNGGQIWGTGGPLLSSGVFQAATNQSNVASQFLAFITLETGTQSGLFEVTWASATSGQTSTIRQNSMLKITKFTL